MGTKVYDNYQDLITFNRNSKGTALRPIGYGDELVVNGTFDTDTSGWVVYNSATISWDSGRIKAIKGSSYGGFAQEITGLTVGRVYTVSAEIEVVNFNQSTVWISESIGGLHVEIKIINGTGVKVYSLQFVATATSMWFNARGDVVSGTGELYGDNVSIKEVLFDREGDPLTLFLHPEGVPRIEYDADRNLKGLLIEPEATNLAFNNNNFNGFSNCTIASVSETNPLGTTTDVFTATFTGTGGFRLNQNITFVSGTTYSMGHFMKFNGQAITLNANGANASIISPSGTFSFDASGQPSSTGDVKYNTYANGWYYVYAVATALLDGATRINWITSETTSIIIYKSQYETGPIATSYMPTTGSPFTRDNDEASMTNVSGLIGQKEGTLYVEVDWRLTAGTSQFLLTASDGTISNTVFISNDSSPVQLRMYAVADGDTKTQQGVASTGFSGIQKIAFAYADADFELYRNGSSISSDTVGSLSALATLTDIDLGQRWDANNQANMHIRAIQIIPRRLSDEQLIELTS